MRIESPLDKYFYILNQLPELIHSGCPWSQKLPVADTVAKQGAAIIDAMSSGQITPSEATSLMQALSAQIKIVEAEELNERVKALEEAHGQHQAAR